MNIPPDLIDKALPLLERLVAASERRAVAMERMVAALEGRALPAPETPKTKAIRLLIEMGVCNVTAVAREAGVHPKTLYKWPETRKTIDKLRSIEAWESRNPRAVSREGVLL